MANSPNKIILDVKGIDENGNEMTQSFRLPTTDDWQKNLLSLNKKIIKKFNPQYQYALCVKKNIISYDDYLALSDIIKNSDSNTPQIEIVSANLLKTTNTNGLIKNKLQKQRRKIIIHSKSDNKQYTFTLPLDINQCDNNIYNELITVIKLNFIINMKNTLKLYENCDGKRLEISDWDDLYESLQDKKLNQTLHLDLQERTPHNTPPNNTPHKQEQVEQQLDCKCDNNKSIKSSEIQQIYQSQTYLLNNNNNNYNYNYNVKSQVKLNYKVRVGKLVLLGDSGVGKSSIEQRFVSNRFDSWIGPTVGAMFSRKTIDFGHEKRQKFTFEIWDTAGQERFKTLAPLYYRNATAALICYDITNYKSYNNALLWIQQVKQYDEDIVIALCGNKVDLYKERNVSYDKVKEWVVMNNIAVFGETSAKTNVNITQMFNNIGEVIINTTQDKKQNGFQVSDQFNNNKGVDDVQYTYCYSNCQIV